MTIKTPNGEIKINVGSHAFNEGYFAGCDDPAFLIGNKLKNAPESDDKNPYKIDT